MALCRGFGTPVPPMGNGNLFDCLPLGGLLAQCCEQWTPVPPAECDGLCLLIPWRADGPVLCTVGTCPTNGKSRLVCLLTSWYMSVRGPAPILRTGVAQVPIYVPHV